MANCGCTTTNDNSQALTPNFSCAPDLSQLLFRFVERKSMGIVKGSNENGVVDMSSFFIPIDSYSLSTITLCGEESRKIELGSQSSKGPRSQIVEFDINEFTTLDINENTTAKLRLLDGATLLSETPDFPAPDFSTFITNLKDSLPNAFKLLSTYSVNDGVSTFEMKAIKEGVEYNYELIFTGPDITKASVTFLLDLSVRTAFNPAATGFISGDWDGNVVNPMIDLGNDKYSYSVILDKGTTYNYFFHDAAVAGVETVDAPCNTGVAGARQITPTTDEILDIVCFSNCTICAGFTGTLDPTVAVRPLVSETINGTETQSVFRYLLGAFKVLMLFAEYCQDCTTANERFIEYADSSDVNANGLSGATWKKMGNMLLLSGADDIEDDDTNLIENIYVRNTHDCRVDIQAIIGL